MMKSFCADVGFRLTFTCHRQAMALPETRRLPGGALSLQLLIMNHKGGDQHGIR
jgi:hypothetical protein